MNIVILCGGTGTRLWPMSRKEKPKQFFSVLSSEPMIFDTFQRFSRHFPISQIYFSTNKYFVNELRKIFPFVKEENYIIEPEKKDTASAMGLAATYLSLRAPDEPMVFVPSDHFIGEEAYFIQTLQIAEGLVQETGKMVDIGIYPLFPSTSLGYTHIGRELESREGIRVYEFLGHKEKPDFDSAKKYLKSGEYLWHGSYYMWTPQKFLDAFHRYDPERFLLLVRIKDTLEKKEDIRELYHEFVPLSFDYAVTEKMDPEEVLILRGDFQWSDIGAWDVLYDRLANHADENKNLIQANWQGIDTSSSLIYGPKNKLIATVGVHDIVVVDTGDVLLICQKGKAQEVKKIVEKLKETSAEFL